ncbi:MAG: hypothetical protein JXR73_11430, partial [Candidatus Omnitrophica bacterium]|nr:hypothetical protein [Candidatus Omnitrophota bacterium]
LMRILDDKRNVHCRLSLGSALILLLVVLLTLPFSSEMAIAQVEGWAKIDIPSGYMTKPTAPIFPSMVYDSHRDVIILHGGGNVDTPGTPPANNLTWEYNGNTWKIISTKGPARYGHVMAYDEERRVVVLCGGPDKGGGTPFPGTWEWNGEEWNEVDAIFPSRRLIPAMAYDPIRKVVVLHGGSLHGSNAGEILSDTWEWDGETWTQVADGPKRWDHEMIYDTVRRKMVMFGGYESLGSTPTDTWEFDGTDWIRVATDGPEGRMGHCLAFDPFRGVAVLFGGFTHPGQGSPAEVVYSDMWEWDGSAWSQIDVSIKPESTVYADMVYDKGKRKIVYFGGMKSAWTGLSNDTWEYTASSSSGMPKQFWTLY